MQMKPPRDLFYGQMHILFMRLYILCRMQMFMGSVYNR